MRAVKLLLISTTAFGLAACESVPLLGDDEPQTFAERLQSIEEDWRDGKKDVERGQELVSDGRDKLRKNEERRARELKDYESTTIALAQQRSAVSSAAASGESTAKIEDMSDRLNKLQKRANEHQEEAEDAADDIRAARKKIEKGERLIEVGNAKMTDAEERYREDAGKSLREQMTAQEQERGLF